MKKFPVLYSYLRTSFYFLYCNSSQITNISFQAPLFSSSPLSSYSKLKPVSSPRQLQQVRGNALGDATWRLCYGECLQRIHAKQISTENIHESITQQRSSHQWPRRLIRHLEMVHTVSGYTATFTITSHRHIQMRQISQDMDNFISSILLKQQQKNLKTNQIRDVYEGTNGRIGREISPS
jgi:hypothetical protein